jgi:hypothetical protein
MSAKVHAGELDHLGLDPLGLDFLQDVPEERRRVTVLASAAVDGENFHASLLVGCGPTAIEYSRPARRVNPRRETLGTAPFA